MLTEQYNKGVVVSETYYEILDFYLSYLLRFAGYDPVGLRPEVGHKLFVFRDRSNRRKEVMGFFGDAISVRPLAFISTIKDTKGPLQNA